MATAWRTVGEVAQSARVDVWTVYRWCRSGLVKARRLASGRGPWRIRVDAEGFPLDGKGK